MEALLKRRFCVLRRGEVNSVGPVAQKDDEEQLKRKPVEVAREWLGNCFRMLLDVFLGFLIWRWSGHAGRSYAEVILGTKVVWGVLNDHKDAFGSLQSLATAVDYNSRPLFALGGTC